MIVLVIDLENSHLYNIETSDFFSDCVFNLDSWIYFHEVVLPIFVNQKFNGSFIAIVGALQ